MGRTSWKLERPTGSARAAAVVLLAVLLVAVYPSTAGADGAAQEQAGSTASAQGTAAVLTLSEAVYLSLRNHPEVTAARQERAVSEAVLLERQVPYRLQLSAGVEPVRVSGDLAAPGTERAEIGRALTVTGALGSPSGLKLSGSARTDGTAEDSGVRVGVSLDLWPPPEYDAAYRALLSARDEAGVAKMREQQARAKAAVDTYLRYRSLQVQRARAALYEQEYDLQAEKLEQARSARSQGLKSQVEVLEAEILVRESRAEYEKARRDYQRTLAGLLQDLQLEEAEDWSLEPLPQELPQPQPEQLTETEADAVAKALAASPDLAQKLSSLSAAERALAAASRDRGFTLSLQGNMRFPEEEWETSTYEVYASFSCDLLDGGEREAALKKAEAAFIKAREAVESARDQIRQTVREKLSELQWLADRAAAANLRRQQRQLAYEAKEKQAARGLLASADLQAAQLQWEQARLDWIELLISAEAARLELKALLGEPLDIEGGATVAFSD